jgi:tellurite methyltransferase
MEIAGWDERYRTRRDENAPGEPTPLLVETVRERTAGRALDLACGTGRNALWLAERGWHVTAVDGSQAAIQILSEHARRAGVTIDASVGDLEAHELSIDPDSFDLVLMLYYLQRDLFEAAKAAVKPGGLLMAIVHTTEGNEEPTASRLRPGGELRAFFSGWRILHEYEGKPRDPAHRRAVAEIVVEKPAF